MRENAKPRRNSIFHWFGGFILICCLALPTIFFTGKMKTRRLKRIRSVF